MEFFCLLERFSGTRFRRQDAFEDYEVAHIPESGVRRRILRCNGITRLKWTSDDDREGGRYGVQEHGGPLERLLWRRGLRDALQERINLSNFDFDRCVSSLLRKTPFDRFALTAR